MCSNQHNSWEGWTNLRAGDTSSPGIPQPIKVPWRIKRGHPFTHNHPGPTLPFLSLTSQKRWLTHLASAVLLLPRGPGRQDKTQCHFFVQVSVASWSQSPARLWNSQPVCLLRLLAHLHTRLPYQKPWGTIIQERWPSHLYAHSILGNSRAGPDNIRVKADSSRTALAPLPRAVRFVLFVKFFVTGSSYVGQACP